MRPETVSPRILSFFAGIREKWSRNLNEPLITALAAMIVAR
jgi:hypothetical protein